MSQRKEQAKTTARDQNEMDSSSMTDRKFKVMIINILTGLEKRVEDISEALNTDIKKNTSEMKSTINESKNTLNGINSRLEETGK